MFITKKNLQQISRKYHKWLMLLLGAQFVIWSITGTYMVFFDIDYIHGDSLVHNHQTKLSVEDTQVSVTEITQKFGEFEQLSLAVIIDKPVYRLTINGSKLLVDANSGTLLSPVSEQLARQIAEYEYTGDGAISAATLIESNPPFELHRSRMPAWRIDFNDFGAPTLYISASTGEVVTKRHEWWRLFDWIFRFHVMDYQGSEIDNTLLFFASALGIVAAFMGLILTYFRVFKGANRRKRPG